MKVFKLLLIVALSIIVKDVFAQLNISGDKFLCGDSLVLKASANSLSATSYKVDSIAHNPWPFGVGGYQLPFNTGPVANGIGMGFNFCFFGNQYSSLRVSSAGWVAFSNNPGVTTYDATALPSPLATIPRNSILGTWTDHSALGCGSPCTWVQTNGVAPFRRFIVTWVDIPHNTCSDTSFFQIVLYETTHIIEVNIVQKLLCLTGLEGGAATVGIQNQPGTIAYTPPGRNATIWSTISESWRFTPDNISWYDPVGNLIGMGDSIKILPPGPTFIYAEAQSCGGGNLSDTILIEEALNSNLISGGGNYKACKDSVLVTAIDPFPRRGYWSVISGNLTVRDPDSISTWVSGVLDSSYLEWVVFNGCDTIRDTMIIYLSPSQFLFTDSLANSCPNDSSGEIHLDFAPGGNLPYSFKWSVGTGNPNTMVPPNTTIALRITDSLGCYIDTVFIVNSHSSIIVGAIGKNIRCYGDSTGSIVAYFPFGKQGPFEYSLSNKSNFQVDSIFSGLTAGNYDLYARDSLGCIYSNNGVIAQPDSFTIMVGSPVDPKCGNDSTGYVNINVSGALPPYQFSSDSMVWQTNDTVFGLPVGQNKIYIRDIVNCVEVVPVTLNAPPPLNISVDFSVDLSCYLANDGMVELSASGGITPYTFSIDGTVFQADSVFTSLVADTISFYVADSINCRDSIDIALTQPDSLVISSSGSSVLCFGDNDGFISLFPSGGTPPYYYIFQNDTLNIDTIYDLTSATYDSIFVVDTNGCMAITSSTVLSPTPLSIDSIKTDSTTCFMGSDGAFQVFVSGGTPPYAYSLDSIVFQSDSSFSNLLFGTYIVYIEDNNGCSIQASDSILDPPPLILDSVLEDSLLTHVSCNGANDGVAVIIPDFGTPPFMFSIDSGTNFQSSDTFQGLAAGNYSVLVEDLNSCLATVNFTITEPASFQVNVASTPTSCFNGSDGTVSVNSNGGTEPYMYSIDTGSSFQPDSFFTGLSSSTYEIMVMDSNSCLSSATVFVDQPTQFQITAVPEAASCFGYLDGSVQIIPSNGTPPYNAFSISEDGINFISQSNSLFTGLPAGNYIAVASDANGCPANTTFDINEPDLDTFNIKIDPTSCFGDQYSNGIIKIANANVNPPYLFSLDGSNFSLDTVYPGLASGIHTLIWQNVNGCFDTIELFVEEPDPLLVFINPDTLVLPLSGSQQVTTNVQGPQDVTYQWLPSDGLSCSDCPDPVVSPFGPSPFEYILLVEVDDQGESPPCYGEGSLIVIIDHVPRYFFPNAFTPNGDGENDIIYVYGEHIKAIDLQIYDRWGTKLFQSQSQHVGWNGEYNGEILGPGVYPYKLTVIYLSGEREYEQGSVTLIR